jgi:hypothetical protein
MKKKSKSDYGTKDVPQPARYIKAGYYTVPELRAVLRELEFHARISMSLDEKADTETPIWVSDGSES